MAHMASLSSGTPKKISVIHNVREYISKILSIRGMKILLLDTETLTIISLVYTQTEIISQNILLTKLLTEDDECEKDGKIDEKNSMGYLKVVIFVRPTDTNIRKIKTLMSRKKYSEYHLFFTNFVPDEYLRTLAEADDCNMIRQIQEYYADFYPVNDNLWHLNLSKNFRLLEDSNIWTKTTCELFDRNIDGVLSCMLSFRAKFAIRYSNYSKLATMFAHEITKRINEEKALFHFGGEPHSLLLILDRKDDPITPLLSQWTYQAMVHELLGIKNNIVNMNDASLHKDLKKIVLSPQDNFYGKSIYLVFNEVIGEINKLALDYASEKKKIEGLSDIKELSKFTENYEEFKKKQSTTTKHLTILTKLSEIANLRNLYDVSQFEQELACRHDHGSALGKILKFMADDKIDFNDKLRLALLYAIRYENETDNQINKLDLMLGSHTVFVNLIKKMGHSSRQGSDILFGDGKGWKTPITTFVSMFKEVKNVFTQHRPYCCDILNLLRITPKLTTYPFAHGGITPKTGWSLIVIYIIGGVTYEESRAIDAMNDEISWRNTKIILGGSCIHNSKSFIEDLIDDPRDIVVDIK